MQPDGSGTGLPPENAQPTNNADSELDRLRKEAEQAKMRANQLANELEERKKLDDEAASAKLKENEEFKTLYEQEIAKRTELEETTRAERRANEARAATEELHKNYSKDVLELAQAAGVTLLDASDEAKAAYKQRLDALSSKVRPSRSPVGGNNPAPSSETPPEKASALNTMRVASGLGNEELLSRGVHEVLKDNPALAQMREMAGYRPRS